MACKCMELVDEKLKEHNTELGFCWSMDQQTGAVTTTVRIATNLIEKRRGQKPLTVMPEFCPFCSKRYVDDADASPSGAEEGAGG
jgi:hypothetical protein